MSKQPNQSTKYNAWLENNALAPDAATAALDALYAPGPRAEATKEVKAEAAPETTAAPAGEEKKKPAAKAKKAEPKAKKTTSKAKKQEAEDASTEKG